MIILPYTSEKTAAETCDVIKRLCKDTELKPLNPSIALGVSAITNENQGIQ